MDHQRSTASLERKVRRMAKRDGQIIMKSRARDFRSPYYGKVYLLDGHTGNLEAEWDSIEDAYAAFMAEAEAAEFVADELKRRLLSLPPGSPKPKRGTILGEALHAFVPPCPKQVKEMIALDLEGTADWRRRKAAEYPDDARNIEASTSLLKLQESLSSLPDSHPLLIKIAEQWESGQGTEHLNECLQAIGFRSDYASAEDLLQELVGA